MAHSKNYLASFEVPRAVVFGKLPNTSTGRIQKFQSHKQAAPAASIEMRCLLLFEELFVYASRALEAYFT